MSSWWCGNVSKSAPSPWAWLNSSETAWLTDPCSQTTTLIGILASHILISGIVFAIINNRHRSGTFITVIKVILALPPIGLTAWEAYLNEIVPSEMAYHGLLIIVLIVEIVQCRRQSTKPQAIFWIAFTVVYSVTIMHDWYSLAAIQLPLYTLLAIIHLFARSRPWSEEGASFFATISYSWMDNVFWIGRKRQLKISEFPEVSDALHVDYIGDKFSSARANTKGGLLRVLVKSFGWPMLGGALIKLTSDILLFTVPQLLRRLIRVFEQDLPQEQGYLWAVLLFACNIIFFWKLPSQICMSNQYFSRMVQVGTQMRTAVMMTIFEKGLRLSATSRARYTTGEITNLMSIDAQRFLDTITYINVVWACPVQFSLAIYFLYDLVGVAAFAGLSVFLIILPINFISGKYGERIQKKQIAAKDERVLFMNEVLKGAKVMKLYAWENPFMEKILAIRDRELKCLRYHAYIFANVSVTFYCSSAFVTLVSFATHVYLDPVNNILTAEKIFACLTIFGIIRIPLVLMPPFLIETIKLIISLKRMNSFFEAEELDKDKVGSIMDDEINSVEMKEASFSWNDEDNVDGRGQLNNINMIVPKGSLVAILGKVGAGKSSLLSAILGEMKLKSGKVNVCGSLAYVSQQAWIQNMTLKQNILFGQELKSPSNKMFYKKVIEACALKKDLQVLPGGDETEIGENGVNLSGGQKQRVNLARAVFSEPEVVLLDDPLSAVDAHVGEHFFRNVIGSEGLLGDTTRLLVTHSVKFLPEVDHIVLLEDGKVIVQGTHAEIKDNPDFREFVKHAVILEQEDEKVTKEEKAEEVKVRARSRTASITEDLSPIFDGEKSRLTQDETMAQGRIQSRHAKFFLDNFGHISFIFLMFLFFGAEALRIKSTFVLSAWSTSSSDITTIITTSDHWVFIRDFAILTCVCALIDYIREFGLMRGCVNVSDRAHRLALEAVMRSPMLFFDSVPTGRTLNRFSSDLDLIDAKIPNRLTDSIWCWVSVAGKFFVIAYMTPVVLAFLAPIVVLLIILQLFYSSTKRQLKRLESISKSPIYAQFSESLQGTSVIRAYCQQQRFVSENVSSISDHLRCSYMRDIATRWLTFRVENLGNLIILLAALFTVYTKDSLSAGQAALSVTVAVMILDELGWCIKMVSELESDSVSLERIREYAVLESESEWYTKDKVGVEPLGDWPADGSIEFEEYSTRYRLDLDEVISKLDLQIKAGEKLGICGRTGAGKSSLALALFRMLEPTFGRIKISGRDVTTLGLQELRSQITIIPQDPVLFSGTLRMNLDPTDAFSDQDLYESLQHAHLLDLVKSLPGGLMEKVSEGGSNLSVGQRQLLCLARALLRKSRILVLDEATAAMDSGTDQAIQETLASEFGGCTVLTIAHRLNTILACDRVLVMAGGKNVEIGPPMQLLKNEESHFSIMCADAGIAVGPGA